MQTGGSRFLFQTMGRANCEIGRKSSRWKRMERIPATKRFFARAPSRPSHLLNKSHGIERCWESDANGPLQITHLFFNYRMREDDGSIGRTDSIHRRTS